MTVFGGNVPSISTQMTMTYRTLEYQFGQGYKQVAPDGINYALEVWALEFDNLNLTRAQALETWMETYADPTMIFNTTMVDGSVAKNYRMTNDGWVRVDAGGNVFTYTFTVEQTF